MMDRPATLYTAEILALAASLAEFPAVGSLPLTGSARSPSCGSNLAIHMALNSDGHIERIGIAAHACAIGQASAAVFAGAAIGRDLHGIAQAEADIAAWLAGNADMPDWPGLASIAPAAAYPARHGAILLAWKAALSALSSTGRHR